MMRQLSDIHLQIRGTTRRFADEVIRSAAHALDREERFLDEIYRPGGSAQSASPFPKRSGAQNGRESLRDCHES